jgi:mRNA-degrading endonuclease RelE of RelBE toxin-antitoxin system
MPPYRIEWLEEARRDVRALDRETAMHVFEGFCFSLEAARAMQGDLAGGFRLRIGDYRVLFTLEDAALRIFGVRHRREAYR